MKQDDQGRRVRRILAGRAGQGDVEAGPSRRDEAVAPGARAEQLPRVQGWRLDAGRPQRFPLTASIVCLEVAMVRSGGPTFLMRV